MTRALILGAGQGTRLRPITDNMPKCLVPLDGISLLERQAATLARAGITEIQVATGYLARQVEERGFETSYNKRFASTNMVESLFCAKGFMKCDEDLIISYGDIVYNDENLTALLNCQEEIAIMVDQKWKDLWSLRLENPLDDAETLVLDGGGFITELDRKSVV